MLTRSNSRRSAEQCSCQRGVHQEGKVAELDSDEITARCRLGRVDGSTSTGVLVVVPLPLPVQQEPHDLAGRHAVRAPVIDEVRHDRETSTSP
jgi:hypothetical protein